MFTWWEHSWPLWHQLWQANAHGWQTEITNARGTLLSESLATGAWANVLKAVEADALVSRQVGHHVGSVLWSRRVEPASLAADFCEGAVAQFQDLEDHSSEAPSDTFDQLF